MSVRGLRRPAALALACAALLPAAGYAAGAPTPPPPAPSDIGIPDDPPMPTGPPGFCPTWRTPVAVYVPQPSTTAPSTPQKPSGRPAPASTHATPPPPPTTVSLPRTAKPGTTVSVPGVPTPVAVQCRNTQPTPLPGPLIPPDQTVGGPKLATHGVVTDLPPGLPTPPTTGDVSWIIADLDTGEVIGARSPHAYMRPASTLKTLTALTLIPRLKPTQRVKTTPQMTQANGTRMGMVLGASYTVDDLFNGLLLASANDAAYGLVGAAGGYDRTIALVRAEAARIGAHDTVVWDPSGLDMRDQRTSAYDLALMGRDAMKLPQFRAYVAKRTATWPTVKDKDGKEVKGYEMANINDFLLHYPGATGIKPGRTDRAQHTLISSAQRGKRRLILVQMGNPSGDWHQTAALMDWGFSVAGKAKPVGRLVDPGEAKKPTPTGTGTPSAASSAPTTSAGTGSSPAASGDPASGDATVAAAPASGSSDSGVSVPSELLWGAGSALVLLGGSLAVSARRRRSDS